MLDIGSKAPEFSLKDQDNVIHHLTHHLAGPEKFILIYFYPKDDTPGCTTEACTIATAYDKFQAEHIKVFGISADSPESHKKFAQKYNLPFTLLSDQSKTTIKAYQAIKESGLFAGGTARVSYIIATTGPTAGTIIKAYPNVDPGHHAEQILKDIITLTIE